MKRFLVSFVVSFLPLVTTAAVAEGENLLINGAFDTEQTELPVFWSASSSRQVSCNRGGGPKGQKSAIVLRADGSIPGAVSMRQQGLVLVAGETYKLSAWIKTKGFKSRHAGFIIHNNGWITDSGFKELPADSDWTFMEKTFKLFASTNKEYGVAMFAVGLIGEMHVADVRLEAISAGALQGSSSQASLVSAPRLVPIQPLLSRIPRANPKLTFGLYGKLPKKPEAYECVVIAGGNRIPAQTLPIKDGKVVASLAGLPVGAYSLEVVLRERGAEQAVVEASYPVRIIEPPIIDRSGIRPLNNLVSVLLDRPLAKAPTPQTFSFVNPRDGWVFVALKNDKPTPGLAVTIDGGAPVITAATARLEAFRELPAGAHRIAVVGGPTGSRLIVRSIPEIFNYPPCRDSYVKENGSYDWDFMKRHILPAVTTLNGGRLPGPALPEAKAMGLKWLANFNVAPVNDPVDLRERMTKHAGFTQPQYDGFTSDELFFGRTTIDNYTQALWGLHNPENRRIYTWIVGKPAIPSLHTDFMSACLNASGGRGRMLFEAYCHPQGNEKAAAAYLDGKLVETMRSFNAFFPNAAAGSGIIFGNFNQIPIISLEHNPGVDFKYFLDMQVNRIANDPAFVNLATTGYWGTYYGDEELVRWSFLLMRHYAVEGRKEMLSKRYGFTYNPGFVANPDFAAGLEGWDTAPAKEGSITTATIPGYGKKVQVRWGGGKAGDTVCAMARTEGKPNRIGQTMRGLEVGKAYSLQFVTADRKSLGTKDYNPRKYGIAAELPGVEILTDRCFVHIDRRKTHRRKPAENLGKINLHRIVFRATIPTQQLAFTDATAKPGEELVLNFVQLKPYLE